MTEPLALPLAEPAPLSLGEPEPLSLSLEPEVINQFVLRLNPDSPYRETDVSSLLGAQCLGFKVIRIDDILPAQGEIMTRELTLRRI